MVVEAAEGKRKAQMNTAGKLKVIVTGAYGLVGSRIIEMWDEWAEVIPLSHEVCDITHRDTVIRTFSIAQPDAVLHLAAYTNVDGAEKESGNEDGQAWKLNVLGTQNVTEAAKMYGAHLYAASTDFVFGDDGIEPHEEESERSPINWYGITKYEAEKIVETYADSCIMRFSYPFRAQYAKRTDFVRTMVSKIKARNLPSLFTDQYITPTFIDDLAPAIQTVITQKVIGKINLCGGSWHTPFEIGVMLAKALGIAESVVKGRTMREYERKNPEYAHRPLNGRTISRRTSSLGFTMHPFPKAIEVLIQQGLGET